MSKTDTKAGWDISTKTLILITNLFMEPEDKKENAPARGRHLHEIIIISKRRKREDVGYSFYETDTYGVIIELSSDYFKYITVKNENEEYRPGDYKEDHEYYYTITKGSEVEYKRKMVIEIENQQNYVNDQQKILDRMNDWAKKFDSEVSLFNKMLRFFKGINTD